MQRLVNPYFLLFLLTALAGVLVQAGYIPTVFSYDDSYIIGRNAANLAHGIEDTAYASSAYAGSSSTAHLIITAAFNLVTSPLKALMLSALLCLFIYITGALYAVRQLVTRPYRLPAMVLFFVVATVPINLVNGLDTTLAMAVAVWLLALSSSQNRKILIIMAIIAGLSPLVRVELAVLAGLLLLNKCYELHRNRLSLALSLPAIAFAVFAAAEVLYFKASGEWLPNTMRAKAAFYAQTCSVPMFRLAHVSKSVLLLVLINLPVSLFIFWGLRDRILQIIFAFTVIFITAYALFLPTGLLISSNGPRYTTLLTVVWAFGFIFALGKNHDLIASRLKFSCAVSVSLSLIFLTVLAGPQYVGNPRMLEDAAQWAKANIPNGSNIILHDAGYFAFATDGKDFHLTDAIGLKSPWVTAVHEEITVPSCGDKRPDAIAEIARRSQPQWAVFTDYTAAESFWNGLEMAGYRLERKHRADHIYIFQLHPLSNLTP